MQRTFPGDDSCRRRRRFTDGRGGHIRLGRRGPCVYASSSPPPPLLLYRCKYRYAPYARTTRPPYDIRRTFGPGLTLVPPRPQPPTTGSGFTPLYPAVLSLPSPRHRARGRFGVTLFLYPIVYVKRKNIYSPTVFVRVALNTVRRDRWPPSPAHFLYYHTYPAYNVRKYNNRHFFSDRSIMLCCIVHGRTGVYSRYRRNRCARYTRSIINTYNNIVLYELSIGGNR